MSPRWLLSMLANVWLRVNAVTSAVRKLMTHSSKETENEHRDGYKVSGERELATKVQPTVLNPMLCPFARKYSEKSMRN